jgi:hypothetical protein
MFLSLIFALTVFVPNRVPVQSDTIPRNRVAAFENEGQAEANEIQQVFHDHYSSGYYPPFEGPITQIASRTYRLDSFTMSIDSVPMGMTGLLSRGLLFPGRLAPWFGSTDTVSIGNLHELKDLSPSQQVRRFSCRVINRII